MLRINLQEYNTEPASLRTIIVDFLISLSLETCFISHMHRWPQKLRQICKVAHLLYLILICLFSNPWMWYPVIWQLITRWDS